MGTPASVPAPRVARLARRARRLSWVSLAWVTAEGLLGLAAGVAAGSLALIGWGLGSAIEGLASVVIIWRFSGANVHSEQAEARAQRIVAVSFFLLAPYLAVEAARRLATGEGPDASPLGIAVTATAVVLMPLLGRAKQRIGDELGSRATHGEGTQNVLCALQAGAVLVGLVAVAAFGIWWLDAVAALVVGAIAVREGLEAWRGRERCCT